MKKTHKHIYSALIAGAMFLLFTHSLAHAVSPIAQDQSTSIYTNVPKSISLVATDADPGDTLTYEIVTSPQHGTATLTYGDGVTYKPATGYTGEDNFTFKATDSTNAVSNDATVTITVEDPPPGAWLPPIGIPEPSFGIRETHMMYEGQTYDFSLDPARGVEIYPDAGNGPYTHYIDNTHPSATDTDNPYGTAAKPRIKIPWNLAAGSVMEIHGGPYNYTDRINIVVNGTPDMPIFIRGEESKTEFFQMRIRLMGQYGVLENIYMKNESIIATIVEGLWEPSTHGHLSIRNCEIEGGGTGAGPYSDNIVFYNNHIHHHIDAFGGDRAGAAVGANCHYIWVVDNEIHHNSGDSFQAGHIAARTTSHIYIGRNEMYSDEENAVDLKDVTDVIVSQNIMYDYNQRGAATVSHDPGQSEEERGPIRAWYIYNEMYNCGVQGANRVSISEDIYFIGNIIHDIQGSAFSSSTPEDIYFIGNTMYNVDDGVFISHAGKGTATIVNNIFGSLSNPGGVHINLGEYYEDNAVVSNNLFQDPMKVNIASVDYIEADPLFVDPGNNDFHLQSSSPAVDAGISSGAVAAVFDTFETLYGIDIRKDIEGTPRPQGAEWDIGAYEYTSAPSFPSGDVNGDGNVNIQDILGCVSVILGIEGDAGRIERSDLNDDSSVNVVDLLAIVQIILGS